MADKRYNIALLVGDISDPFSKSLAAGAIEAAALYDTNLTIFPGKYVGIQEHYNKYDTAYEYQYNSLFSIAGDAKFDYMIVAVGTICYTYDNKKKREFLQGLGDTPILVLNSKVDGYESLQFDNRTGINDAVDWLAKQGRKHICIMAGDLNNSEFSERYNAYREALERNGLEFWPEYMTPCDITGDCYNEAERLVDRNPEMDAIICVNDRTAQVIYDVLKSHGIKIGMDVAVVGFDDLPEAIEMLPPLASVRASAEGLASRAVKAVINKLNNVKEPVTDCPAELVLRASAERKSYMEAQYEKIDRNEKAELLEKFANRRKMENIFIRDTLMFGGDLKYSYARIMKQLAYIGASTSFIYTFEEPLTHNFKDDFPRDNSWIFRSYSYGRASQTVPPEEQKMNTRQVFDNGYLCTNRQHCFVVADLFTADVQYGIALLEPASTAFLDELDLVTYQLSSAIRALDMLGKQAALVEELHAKNLVLEELTKNDELTGLFNRRGFYLAAEAMISERTAAGDRYVVCYADMNNLKDINEEYGQLEGDSALKLTASCIEAIFGSGGVIGRLGSAEFAVILPKDDSLKLGFYIERKEDYLQALNDSGSKPYKLDISMGITEYTCRNSYDLRAAIDKADGLLFVEKELRRRKL